MQKYASHIWVLQCMLVTLSVQHRTYSIRFHENRHSFSQCFGSVKFWYGSGPQIPYHWITDPDPDTTVLDSQLLSICHKKLFFFFSQYLIPITYSRYIYSTSVFKDNKYFRSQNPVEINLFSSCNRKIFKNFFKT